jgi:UDP-N-acetylmuramate dehydrogenase
VLERDGDVSIVRVAAGENWNDFVQWSLMQGFVGLENLVMIPGLNGAAPIQNIGAYGVEVREFVHAVEAFDWKTGSLTHLDSSACAFAYRDSIFKREPSRYLVTAVEFALSRTRRLRLDYAGVRDELNAMNVDTPTAPLVAEAVCRLRTRKLPNPALIGNAGSFFKNPIVAEATEQALVRDHPSLPTWPADSMRKLSAAWLIDACGLKNYRQGDAGVSAQHALVLVNHGHATGEQIWAVAQHVIETVRQRFGVTLEPEPVIV